MAVTELNVILQSVVRKVPGLGGLNDWRHIAYITKEEKVDIVRMSPENGVITLIKKNMI